MRKDLTMKIDLNCDMGENIGNDDDIMPYISSANIACGFHAGDENSMQRTIRLAKRYSVAVGVHPSWKDREGFGRHEMSLPVEEVESLILYQLGALYAIAKAEGVELLHVKPHGALYNMAARDPALAEAVGHGILAADSSLFLFAPARSALARAGEAAGLRVAREVFADRNYQADGTLVPRSQPNAILHEPEAAAERVLRMLREGLVRAVDGSEIPIETDTICIHGDTPEAVEFAQKLRAALEDAGVAIAAP